jgi:hypothetical protein
MSSVQFTPVETGDMSEIPPDAPAGEWEAVCRVRQAKTSKDSFPMLILEWKLTEALTDGNEDHVGAKVTDFLVFFPGTHAASKMSKIRLKKMCEALSIELPSVAAIKSWDDIADFVKELEGLKAKIYTSVGERKDTGEMVTSVFYAPKGGVGVKAAGGDEDDEDEKPAPKKSAKKPARRH